MLHKIQLPACEKHLRWIVALQRRVLATVCQENITKEDVSAAWLTHQISDLGLTQKWVEGLCTAKDTIKNLGLPLLNHLQNLAACPANLKPLLLIEFDNDIQCLENFADQNRGQLHGLTQIERLLPEEVARSFRGFLEIWYAPQFYAQSGYQIPGTNENCESFNRNIFIDEYRRCNQQVRVCPYCDGQLGDPQVDHFYPKAKYPQFSCHPLNLVPVCKDCNDRANKGEQIPLDDGAIDQMTEWFHPYLRAAINDMSILFELNQGGLLPKLQHKDVLMHHRFEKMDRLLKLQRRWSRELPTIIQHTQRKISQTVRREGKQKFAQPEHLLTKLTEWAEEVYENEWGLITFSILRWHYWRDAASRNPVTFDELWIYCNDNSFGTDAERKF